MVVFALRSKHDDKNSLLRFLQANDYKIKDTIAAIQRHVKALESELIINIENVKKFQPLGIIHFYGRDIAYRPLMIINVRKILDSKITETEFKDLLLYCNQWGISNLCVDGKVEALNALLDVSDVSLLQAPVSMLKHTVALLQKNYRCRMYKLYVFKPPSLVKGLFKLVKPLMSKFTVAKVCFIDPKDNLLVKDFTAANVEEKFGGKAPMQSVFLPPMPK
jgi:hypothetical protein